MLVGRGIHKIVHLKIVDSQIVHSQIVNQQHLYFGMTLTKRHA